MQIYRDRANHLQPHGWPDDYTHGVVEAVHLLEAASRDAEAKILEGVG